MLALIPRDRQGPGWLLHDSATSTRSLARRWCLTSSIATSRPHLAPTETNLVSYAQYRDRRRSVNAPPPREGGSPISAPVSINTPPREGGSPTSAPVSFEEFRLYYESAERVTERRLSLNRWNYSVSTAIILAIGVILSFSTSHETFRFVAAVGTLFLSGMAFLFCSYWIKQI